MVVLYFSRLSNFAAFSSEPEPPNESKNRLEAGNKFYCKFFSGACGSRRIGEILGAAIREYKAAKREATLHEDRFLASRNLGTASWKLAAHYWQCDGNEVAAIWDLFSDAIHEMTAAVEIGKVRGEFEFDQVRGDVCRLTFHQSRHCVAV